MKATLGGNLGLARSHARLPHSNPCRGGPDVGVREQSVKTTFTLKAIYAPFAPDSFRLRCLLAKMPFGGTLRIKS